MHHPSTSEREEPGHSRWCDHGERSRVSDGSLVVGRHRDAAPGHAFHEKVQERHHHEPAPDPQKARREPGDRADDDAEENRGSGHSPAERPEEGRAPAGLKE